VKRRLSKHVDLEISAALVGIGKPPGKLNACIVITQKKSHSIIGASNEH